MSQLTLKQLLTVIDMSPEALKSLRRRNQIALAFGLRHAWDGMTFLPIDAVAMLVRGSLTPIYAPTMAAEFVRSYADILISTIAEAEQHRDDAYGYFSIIDIERVADGQKSTLALGSLGLVSPDHVRDLMAKTPGTDGFIAMNIHDVNVSLLIKAIRNNAARHGIDLTAAFMYAPGSPEYQKLMSPFVEARAHDRDQAIVTTAKARTKREALIGKAGEQSRKLMI
jgi:hypothetical protein